MDTLIVKREDLYSLMCLCQMANLKIEVVNVWPEKDEVVVYLGKNVDHEKAGWMLSWGKDSV